MLRVDSPRSLRRLLNIWPPFLFTGIRVLEIGEDWRSARVRLRMHAWNRNAVGSHFGGSLLSRSTIQHQKRSGVGAAGKGRDIGIRGVNYNILDAGAQRFRNNLREKGGGSPGVNQQIERAIFVELEAGSGHALTRAGAAVHGESDTDAAPETSLTRLSTLLFPLEFFFDNPQAFGKTIAAHRCSAGCFFRVQGAHELQAVAHFEPVAPSEFQSIHAQLTRDFVHVALQREKALGRAVTGEGSGWRQIGVDDVGLKTLIGRAVQWQGLRAGIALHTQRMSAIGAGAGQEKH